MSSSPQRPGDDEGLLCRWEDEDPGEEIADLGDARNERSHPNQAAIDPLDSFRSVCSMRCGEDRPIVWTGTPGRSCIGSCGDAIRARTEPRNDQVRDHPWRAQSTPRPPSAGRPLPPIRPRRNRAGRRPGSRLFLRMSIACGGREANARSRLLTSRGGGCVPSRSRSISSCSGFICPWRGNACCGSVDRSRTHLRSTFSWTSRSRAAWATATPRSLINLTASSLNSRLNFLLCIPTLQFRQTPYLGVHETGSRPNGGSAPRSGLGDRAATERVVSGSRCRRRR